MPKEHAFWCNRGRVEIAILVVLLTLWAKYQLFLDSVPRLALLKSREKMAFILSTKKKKKIAHILDGRAVVLECGQVLSGDSGGHHWGEEPCKWVAAWETAKHPTGQRTAYSKEVSGPKHQWSMVSEPHTKTQSCKLHRILRGTSCGCFGVTRAEWDGVDVGCITHRAPNVYHLALQRKGWLIPDLGSLKNVAMFPWKSNSQRNSLNSVVTKQSPC